MLTLFNLLLNSHQLPTVGLAQARPNYDHMTDQLQKLYHCQKCKDTDIALFGTVCYISVIRNLLYVLLQEPMAAQTLTRVTSLPCEYMYGLLTIYLPSAISLLATDIYSDGS